MSNENADTAVADALVEQARVRLERAVAAGAGKSAQAALQALTAAVVVVAKETAAAVDDDATPVPFLDVGK